MRVTHEIPYKHDGDVLKAADVVLAALGHGADFKLKADKEDDTLHGAVTIQHFPDRLVVHVDVYEQDEPPEKPKDVFDRHYRKSTLKRPARMPTREEICACIDKVKKG